MGVAGALRLGLVWICLIVVSLRVCFIVVWSWRFGLALLGFGFVMFTCVVLVCWIVAFSLVVSVVIMVVACVGGLLLIWLLIGGFALI